jgi:hypothetical protein
MENPPDFDCWRRDSGGALFRKGPDADHPARFDRGKDFL